VALWQALLTLGSAPVYIYLTIGFVLSVAGVAAAVVIGADMHLLPRSQFRGFTPEGQMGIRLSRAMMGPGGIARVPWAPVGVIAATLYSLISFPARRIVRPAGHEIGGWASAQQPTLHIVGTAFMLFASAGVTLQTASGHVSQTAWSIWYWVAILATVCGNASMFSASVHNQPTPVKWARHPRSLATFLTAINGGTLALMLANPSFAEPLRTVASSAERTRSLQAADVRGLSPLHIWWIAGLLYILLRWILAVGAGRGTVRGESEKVNACWASLASGQWWVAYRFFLQVDEKSWEKAPWPAFGTGVTMNVALQRFASAHSLARRCADFDGPFDADLAPHVLESLRIRAYTQFIPIPRGTKLAYIQWLLRKPWGCAAGSLFPGLINGFLMDSEYLDILQDSGLISSLALIHGEGDMGSFLHDVTCSSDLVLGSLIQAGGRAHPDPARWVKWATEQVSSEMFWCGGPCRPVVADLALFMAAYSDHASDSAKGLLRLAPVLKSDDWTVLANAALPGQAEVLRGLGSELSATLRAG
jgi:hypothetical protein